MPSYSTKYRRGDEVWFVHTTISDKYAFTSKSSAEERMKELEQAARSTQ